MTFRLNPLRLISPLFVLVALFTTTSALVGQDSVFDEPLMTDEPAAGSTSTNGASTDPLADDSGLETQVDPQAEFTRKMEEAQALMDQRNWAGALAIYNQLAMYRNAVVSLNQGVCYYQLGQLEPAISAFSYALVGQGAASTPGFLERVHLLRGQSYVELGNYRDAFDDFYETVRLNPTSPEPLYHLGRTQLRQVATSPGGGMDVSGQSTLLQAAKSLAQAITLRSDYGEAYLERGRVLFYLRQMDEAIADFQQAVQHLGPNSEAGAELGLAYSLRATQESYRPSPNEAQLLQDLRSALASLNSRLAGAQLGEQHSPWDVRDPLESRLAPERLLLSRADTQLALGNELTGEERAQQYRAALADAEELLRHDVDEQDLGRAHYIRGTALRLLGDLDGAIAAFGNAIQVFEAAGASYADAYLRRGICYYYQDKLDVALQDFRAASTVQNNPYIYEPRAMMWMGVVQSRQGDPNEALRSFTRSITAAPRYVPAYLNRGLAYMNLGRYEKAIEDFNVILRQQPNHADARRFRELASQQLDSIASSR